MRRTQRMVACTGIGMMVACLTAGASDVPVFKTARSVAAKIQTEYCRERPFYTVKVLKNADGDIGGYVLIPSIRDSLIPFLDAEGEALTSFHIFASDEDKNKAEAIITPLRQQFPLEEALDCTAR
ncbi:MAG: hypothetical protein JSS58_08360 [Proteobacteria bacterium]|nr:hypothetical protein [Pseudomonadota bacterium]